MSEITTSYLSCEDFADIRRIRVSVFDHNGIPIQLVVVNSAKVGKGVTWSQALGDWACRAEKSGVSAQHSPNLYASSARRNTRHRL